jgi:ATP-dependent DNA helicase RecG
MGKNAFHLGRGMAYKTGVSSPTGLLHTPLAALPSVGPKHAGLLERLELRCVEDLLLHRPLRYEDRRHFLPIFSLKLEEAALTRGKIVAAGLNRYRHGERSVYEFILDDGTGRLHCRWWNQPFMEKRFNTGDDVVVFGRPNSLRPRTMDHPETEVVQGDSVENLIHLNRIAPVYPLTEGLPQRWLRSLMWRVVGEFAPGVPEPEPEIRVTSERVELQNPLENPTDRSDPTDRTNPPSFAGASEGRQSVLLPSRADALRMLHFPEEMGDVEIAVKRLALDEYVALQRALLARRKTLEARARTLPCAGDHNRLIKPFLARLGFELTASQTKVLREIRRDMGGPAPMRRLLQGDVGSGKTVVAACAMLMALESGADAALMAPTEVLAEQHAQNFRRWMEPLGVAVEVRTGGGRAGLEAAPRERRPTGEQAAPRERRPTGEQAAARERRATGADVAWQERRPAAEASRPRLYIGTHALLEASFAPARLGLVIIDEQHKFGVAQREQLVRKGRYPHLLVMTATPIPRTLGLTLYGDLDISVIEQGPPGRGRVRTFLRAAESLPRVWAFAREKLAQGRQAYVIYSRVEDEDSSAGVKAAAREWHELEKIFAPWKVGLLHGRLKSREKEQVMAAFRAGETRVLLATSVVEVGVDVPNATLMVIENADHFGLAQLHQLRGRIGRGAAESCCILIAAAKTAGAGGRLKTMVETTDGFKIAEADLKLRGTGEMLGRRQSGVPRLRFGDLAADAELVELARALVKRGENV